MIINISTDTKTDPERLRKLLTWLNEFFDYYHVGTSARNVLRYSVMTAQGSSKFIGWMEETKKIKMKFWEITDSQNPQYGFLIEDTPNLTFELLK